MQFTADFHIHSHYSIATSKHCDPDTLCMSAARKGLQLIGTGDLTHPKWREELKESLIDDGQGLYRLKDQRIRELRSKSPELDLSSVRFVLSGEISSIYKRGGKTRKVHNLVMVPSFEYAERIAARLEVIGNIRADGRPILGLDSRDLLEICLEECPDSMFIPAHIWTPHFSLLGAKSGFDTIAECFGDLTSHLIAVETGLSSDPPMNWRLSDLDLFPLVSNSDAHSPANLAREANLFDCELSYSAVREALSNKTSGFLGTLEFFPEEGKYHYDGHRKCGVRWSPAETRENEGICPVCGRQVTLGVLHRVEMLADRAAGVRPMSARHYERLVPLSSVISAAVGFGPNTAAVRRVQSSLTHALGSELAILRVVPIHLIQECGGDLVAEGIRRVREGQLTIAPGYDGEYGHVEVFTDAERRELSGQAKLFETSSSGARRGRGARRRDGDPGREQDAGPEEEAAADESTSLVSLFDSDARLPKGQDSALRLNAQQTEAASVSSGTVVVLAGPGTGKTRTLTYRVRELIENGAIPCDITAVTFTRKAAAEISQRLSSLVPGSGVAESIHVGTFHSICMRILKAVPGLDDWVVIDESDRMLALEEACRSSGGDKSASMSSLSREISLLKARCIEAGSPLVRSGLAEVYSEYERILSQWSCLDYDDVILRAIHEWERNSEVPREFGHWFRHLLVDEFQDVNEAQYRLVRLWSSESESLFVIGDPDQSIYQFRGSDSRFFSVLSSQAPGVRLVNLVDSYRSQRVIAAAASAVISQNPGNRESLRTVRPEGVPVISVECPSDLSEAIAVVQETERLVGGTDMIQAHGQPSARWSDGTQSEYSFSDIAVMFRTGRQGDILEECFIKAGIPYRVAGQKDAGVGPEVDQALAILKLLTEPESTFRWLHCLRLARYKLSAKGFHDVAHAFTGTDRRARELAYELARNPSLSASDRENLELLTGDLSEIGRLPADLAPRELIEAYLGRIEQPLTTGLQRLLAVADESESVTDMHQNIIFGKDADWERLGYGRPDSEHVSLMTIHAAKGLEFSVVFVTGCEEGLLPLTRASTDDVALEEERRLFYVAMTRAKDCLYLTHARKRARYPGNDVRERSRFIAEIPKEYLKVVTVRPRRKEEGESRQVSLF